MEGLFLLLSLAAFIGAWVWFYRFGKAKGWGWPVRHVGGFAAGFVAMFVAVMMLSPFTPAVAPVPKADAEPVQQAAVTPAPKPAPPPAPEPAAPPPPPVDVAALAVETHDFLDGAIKDLNLGIQANDWQGIHDEVELPIYRIMDRWKEVPMPERMPYIACWDALDSLRLLTYGVTASSDSLRRRRTMLKDGESFDRNMATCGAVTATVRNG